MVRPEPHTTRSAEIRDLQANVAGIVVGTLLGSMVAWLSTLPARRVVNVD